MPPRKREQYQTENETSVLCTKQPTKIKECLFRWSDCESAVAARSVYATKLYVPKRGARCKYTEFYDKLEKVCDVDIDLTDVTAGAYVYKALLWDDHDGSLDWDPKGYTKLLFRASDRKTAADFIQQLIIEGGAMNVNGKLVKIRFPNHIIAAIEAMPVKGGSVRPPSRSRGGVQTNGKVKPARAPLIRRPRSRPASSRRTRTTTRAAGPARCPRTA